MGKHLQLLKEVLQLLKLQRAKARTKVTGLFDPFRLFDFNPFDFDPLVSFIVCFVCLILFV